MTLKDRFVLILAILLLCCLVYTVQSSSSKNGGICQLYNGTQCSEFLNGHLIYIENSKGLHRQERKLRKWFNSNKENGQISRECWQHAKALTCMHFYPECNSKKNEPIRKPLCEEHCRYIKNEMCHGEYQRALRSKYYQEYLPPCEETSLLYDPKGIYCFKLPTYDSKKAPVPYAEPQKKFRREVGSMVVLKCSFSIRNFLWNKGNKQMIREGTWYRANKRIVANRRYSIRTKSKGRARLFMLLKIRKVNRNDAGKYRCVVSFGGKTVTSGADLVITQPKIKPVVVTKDKKPDLDMNIQGTCVSYKGSVCSRYFNHKYGKDLVFQDYNQPIRYLDSQLEKVIQGLKRTKKLSKRCEEFGQAVLCYHKFRRCHHKKNIPVQTLCKRDCLLFRDIYCKRELQMVSKTTTNNLLFELVIPQCDALSPDETTCTPIKEASADTSSGNQTRQQFEKNMNCFDPDFPGNYVGTYSTTRTGVTCDKWYIYKGYENVPHNFCRNFNDNIPWCFVKNRKEYCTVEDCRDLVAPVPCYEGTGEEYLGKVSVAKSGRKCLRWNDVTPQYSNVYDAYCRNYKNDLSAPWCFVDHKTKELCDIPKCVVSASTRESPVSLVAYVVPSIVGSSLILFSLFLLAFYLKNKKLLKEKYAQEKEVFVEKTDDTDLHKMNTLSTNASYDFNKETPVSECNTIATPPLEIIPHKRSKKSVPEVKEVSLINLEKIGDGIRGQLWQGDYVHSRDRIIPVIVRKLKADTRSCVSSAFRQEMNSLRHLKHRNIEQLICVSAMSEVPFMAFEGKQKLDLKEFLKDNNTVQFGFLTDCIYQIASGLDYLHQQKVLHKDLAARNCFILPDGTVCISKSGLGMYRYPNDYMNIPGQGPSPIRWLSPETLQTGIYRTSTDIYMLGIVIWEIFSFGERPFHLLPDDDVIQEVLNGNNLTCPESCPISVWNIAEECWKLPGCQRPPAFLIRQAFRGLTSA